MNDMMMITKYEKAYILGIRLLELEGGEMPVFSTNPKDYIHLTMADIAEKDVKSGKLPYILQRKCSRQESYLVKVVANYGCEVLE